MADHDNVYALLFSHADMVADLLRGFVHEEWVRELDFSTLEKLEVSFVNDHLRHREGDLLWRLSLGRDRWLYLYFLLELEPEADPFVAVRLMTYLGMLYQRLIRARLVDIQCGLPQVLPVVFYSGSAPSEAAEDVADLVESSPGGLERYRPHLRYLLLDESHIPGSDRELLRNRAAALKRSRELDLEDIRAMLAERVEEWTRAWVQEGVERALDEARSALVELLEQRFGQVPYAARRRIKGIGTAREIVMLSARAATAPSLDTLGLGGSPA